MTAGMVVRRVQTDSGSRIEPPLDDRWSELRRLEWKAAVVGHDAGLDVTVEPTWVRVSRRGWMRAVKGQYTVYVGASSSGPFTFTSAWDFLAGVNVGIRVGHMGTAPLT